MMVHPIDCARELAHLRADLAKVDEELRVLAVHETRARYAEDMMLARAEAAGLREWRRALARRIEELEGG